ncbi:hypothetical protein CEF21_00910 [Bacillus sp. FJAT-42376]|uniref:hypothetical protein n=1 Tax=Bacillus sp. FJAT-42376 TaxID=2014076 RepID=UPI000F5030E9|nr:hypothetical protein [Bacillus sp. FJAT-42376]AZB41014.1 hypothetical protein CEF21_00910 [Bacillus sp. FJAT-42376]
MKPSDKRIERGQAITFRVPSDTPDHLLKQLSKLKEMEKRNFSSRIGEFVLKGVSDSLSKERQTLTIPLPRQLTKEQRNWLKHEHSEALLGSMIHQLLLNPVRATALLASMNSHTLDPDDLIMFEDQSAAGMETDDRQENPPLEELPSDFSENDDDLEGFSFDQMQDQIRNQDAEEVEIEESAEDLLGDFLSSMNK